MRETEVVLTFKLWHQLPQDRPPFDSFRSMLELGGAIEVLQELAITQTIAEGHVVIATWQKIEFPTISRLPRIQRSIDMATKHGNKVYIQLLLDPARALLLEQIAEDKGMNL